SFASEIHLPGMSAAPDGADDGADYLDDEHDRADNDGSVLPVLGNDVDLRHAGHSFTYRAAQVRGRSAPRPGAADAPSRQAFETNLRSRLHNGRGESHYLFSMSTSRLSSQEIRAAAEAHRELGPEYHDAVVESFLAKVEREIEARVDA